MITAARSPSPMGRALLASFAVHALVALSIPILTWTPASTPPVETISFEHVSHIEIERRQPRPRPQAVAAHPSARVAVNLTSRIELAHTASRKIATPLPAVPRRASAAPVVADVSRPGDAAGTGSAAPEPTATPGEQRAVASSGTHDTGGYMPFGAEQPDPVLDPGIRKRLDGMGVHVTIVVLVGDDGRTKSVRFDPAIDPQLEAKIQSLLADASWDPAVCGGGINCEGRATIKL